MRQERVLTQKKFTMEINEMTWTPTGDRLLIATGIGTVEVVEFDKDAIRVSGSVTAHTSNCYCIDFDMAGKNTFAVGSADAIVSLWDYGEMACMRTICRLEYKHTDPLF